MKLLKVFPITKGLNKENLSYFTGADIGIGSIVKVPLRKKKVSAIVVSSEDITEAKEEIKKASFATKKIEKIKSATLLSPDFMTAVQESALFFATTAGNILNSVIPKNIIENADKVKIIPRERAINRTPEKLVIQSNDEERYATYKSLIREEFAKGFSVFFCLPTIQDIKKAHEKLAKGIEQYTFVLHSSMSKKEQIDLWSKASNESHPVLIISTGSFLGIARNDIGTIIVDKENSRSYKNQIKPFVDFRIFAEILANKISSKIKTYTRQRHLKKAYPRY